jgi:hypothetical protein
VTDQAAEGAGTAEHPGTEGVDYGWGVIDPDGNVVQSGPGITLQADSSADQGGDDPEGEDG